MPRASMPRPPTPTLRWGNPGAGLRFYAGRTFSAAHTGAFMASGVAFHAADQAIGLPDLDGGVVFEQVVGVFEGLGVVAEAAVDRAADVAVTAQMVKPVGVVRHGAVPP